MRHLAITLALLAGALLPAGAYTDHRGHNVDSLERVVARWTPEAIDNATEEELIDLNRAYRDLMLGYEVINGEKAVFYARKAIAISRRKGWTEATGDAARHIGQYFYAREQFDSAMVWFQESLACVEKMAAGATSPSHPEGYAEIDIDDSRSSLYGAIGNLYNVMGDIPTAMDYYGKAGEIFDKHGWNESNSVLYYNIGETWVDEKDYAQALPAYEKSLNYARTAGDSLLVANALKGLGGLYLDTGKTWKALRCLQEADKYYSLHDDQEFRFRMENLDFMSQVLQGDCPAGRPDAGPAAAAPPPPGAGRSGGSHRRNPGGTAARPGGNGLRESRRPESFRPRTADPRPRRRGKDESADRRGPLPEPRNHQMVPEKTAGEIRRPHLRGPCLQGEGPGAGVRPRTGNR